MGEEGGGGGGIFIPHPRKQCQNYLINLKFDIHNWYTNDGLRQLRMQNLRLFKRMHNLRLLRLLRMQNLRLLRMQNLRLLRMQNFRKFAVLFWRYDVIKSVFSQGNRDNKMPVLRQPHALSHTAHKFTDTLHNRDSHLQTSCA